MSKTIEEAAVTHANNTYPNRPLENEAARQGFIDGGYYSLTHQWRSVEDELPEDDDTVFVSDENGYHIASYFNGEWYSSDDEFTRNPQMWLPIPSLNPEQR